MVISIIQIIVSVLLIIAILFQQRGGGLSGIFGGGETFYGTRRGAEKTVFTITIILAVVFLALGIVNFFVK